MDNITLNYITIWISVVSIFFAWVSLVISYLTYKLDKPNIKIKYFLGDLYSSWIWKTNDILNIDIINEGKRPITINKQIWIEFMKKKWGYIIPLDNINYLWYNWKQFERLNEYSKMQIVFNLNNFLEIIKEKWDDIYDIKRIGIWDSLWNSYFIILKKEDKDELNNLMKKIKK